MAEARIILKGGLGNQLFQLAAAFFIRENRRPIELDDSYIAYRPQMGGYTRRESYLSALQTEFRVVRGWDKLIAYGVIKKLGHWRTWSYVKDAEERFPDLAGFSAEQSLLLDGYWQYACIVERVIAQLRLALNLEFSDRGRGDYWKARIQQASKPIAVHIRRGDYISNRATAAGLGFLGAEYYRRGFDIMLRRMGPGATGFIFSDDIDWCRRNLALQNCEYVPASATGADTTVDDLALMSLCVAHLISNSTYSWWSASLSQRTSLVIGPAIWFKGSNGSHHGLRMSSWEYLE